MPPKTVSLSEKDIKHTIDMAAGVIRKYLKNDYRVILFGPWAEGRAASASDIDIAISGGPAVDEILMAKIREDIDNLPTLRKIDVIDLSVVDEVFRKKVLEEGKALA